MKKTDLEKLPPHNDKAERGLLSCVMLDRHKVMPELRHVVDREIFYDLRHAAIWDAACKLHDAQMNVDYATIETQLKESGADISIPYLVEIMEGTPTSANWPTFLAKLQSAHVLRSIIKISTEFSARAFESGADAGKLQEQFEQSSLSIRGSLNKKHSFADNTALRSKLLADYSSAMDGVVSGIKTGFPDLDFRMGALKEQEFIVLAGTPSSGKTSLVLNILVRAAKQHGTKSAIISLETSSEKIMHRLNAIVSGASGERMASGRPTAQDLCRMESAGQEIKKISDSILIYDQSGLTPRQCVSVFRQAYSSGARLFVVDYLQLLQAGFGAKGAYEKMTEISKAMKNAAKELQTPVICIASLNRRSNQEQRAPMISDLRDSGQIEYDADKIILLHSDDTGPEARTVLVNLAKNKDGGTGSIKLVFFPDNMQFHDASKIDDNDVPTRKVHND